jgi:hypothetical protein
VPSPYFEDEKEKNPRKKDVEIPDLTSKSALKKKKRE